jgi:transcriptional regulator with XRE-family HTH domain
MDKPKFGKKLNEVRKSNGLTQVELAEKCQFTLRTIQRIEAGIVEPRFFTIKTLSRILDYDFFTVSKFTGDEIKHKNLHLSKFKALSYYMKDLFNLKINPMRKLSILTPAFLIIGMALFLFISEAQAQNKKEITDNSIIVFYNHDKSVKRIEARFSNHLTYDSLVYVKNRLITLGITINYRKIIFDDNNQLLEIDCSIDCNDGYKGSFAVPFLNSDNINERRGFFRDYTKNAKSPFCTGGCGL